MSDKLNQEYLKAKADYEAVTKALKDKPSFAGVFAVAAAKKILDTAQAAAQKDNLAHPPAKASGSPLYTVVYNACTSQMQGSGDTTRGFQLSQKFCQDIADGYDSWYKAQIYAGILPVGSTVPLVIPSLQVYKMASWGVTFGAYWQSTIWVPLPPYSLGVTIDGTPVGAAMQPEINALFMPDRQWRTLEQFAQRLSTILYTYTTKLHVLGTRISPPPPTDVLSVG